MGTQISPGVKTKPQNEANKKSQSTDLNNANGIFSKEAIEQQRILNAKIKVLNRVMDTAHLSEININLMEKDKEGSKLHKNIAKFIEKGSEIVAKEKSRVSSPDSLKSMTRNIERAFSSGKRTIKNAEKLTQKPKKTLPTKEEISAGLKDLKSKDASVEKQIKYIDRYTKRFNRYLERL